MYLYVQISFDFPCTGLAFTWVYYSNIATLYVHGTYLTQLGFNTWQYLCWVQQTTENWKLIGVKTMSLFVYRIQLLLSGVLQVFQNRNHNLQRDYMTCCPTNKVIKYCTELLAM